MTRWCREERWGVARWHGAWWRRHELVVPCSRHIHHQAQGKPAEAVPLLARALAIWEAALGPDHPDVALGCSALAMALRDDDDRTSEVTSCCAMLCHAVSWCVLRDHDDRTSEVTSW